MSPQTSPAVHVPLPRFRRRALPQDHVLFPPSLNEEIFPLRSWDFDFIEGLDSFPLPSLCPGCNSSFALHYYLARYDLVRRIESVPSFFLFWLGACVACASTTTLEEGRSLLVDERATRHLPSYQIGSSLEQHLYAPPLSKHVCV